MSCIVQGIDGRNTGGKRCALRSGRPSLQPLFMVMLEFRQTDFDIPRALGRLQSLNSITGIVVVNAESNPSGLVRLTTCVIAHHHTPT
jgi:hypothetical protein